MKKPLKLYGLIGYPIAHSLSPYLFKHYAPQRSYAEYQLFPLTDIRELETILIEHRPLGLNVTAPHKEQVLQVLPNIQLSPEVKYLGVSNTLAFRYEDRRGNMEIYAWAYNTDICGFETSLKRELEAKPKCIILGTGGVAKAVTFTLKSLGYSSEDYTLISRNEQEATNRLTKTTNIDCRIHPYESLRDLLEQYDLVINARPRSLSIQMELNFPYDALRPRHLCYDLNYGESLFLNKAKLYGASCKDGEEMLRLQAEASWAIWQQHE